VLAVRMWTCRSGGMVGIGDTVALSPLERSDAIVRNVSLRRLLALDRHRQSHNRRIGRDIEPIPHHSQESRRATVGQKTTLIAQPLRECLPRQQSALFRQSGGDRQASRDEGLQFVPYRPSRYGRLAAPAIDED